MHSIPDELSFTWFVKKLFPDGVSEWVFQGS